MESNIPSPQDVIKWPKTILQQKIEAEKAELETRLQSLQEQAAKLQDRLESGMIMEQPNWTKRFTPEELANYQARQAEEESGVKLNIIANLGKLSLEDGDSVTAEYTEEVDHDFAGGYNVLHKIVIAHKAGVYLLGRQYRFANNTGVQRDLRPHFEQYIIHPDAPAILKRSEVGIAANLTDISIADTEPEEWLYSDSQSVVQESTEAIRTASLIDAVLTMVSTDNLRPLPQPGGNVSEYELCADRSIEITPGLEIWLRALYDRQSTYDYHNRRSIELEPSFSGVIMELSIGGKRKEMYYLDNKTLEIRPDRYSTYDGSDNQHPHDDAENILQLAQSATVKDKS